jgi:hypothetical protein
MASIWRDPTLWAGAVVLVGGIAAGLWYFGRGFFI